LQLKLQQGYLSSKFYEVMGWEGLHQVALTSRKHELDLWHKLICVKPNKHDFTVSGKAILNNFYLPVII
jgi:hypothetical protein